MKNESQPSVERLNTTTYGNENQIGFMKHVGFKIDKHWLTKIAKKSSESFKNYDLDF